MAKNNGKKYIISMWDSKSKDLRYLFALYVRGGLPEVDLVDCCCYLDRTRLPKFTHAEAHCLCAFLQASAQKSWHYGVMVP